MVQFEGGNIPPALINNARSTKASTSSRKKSKKRPRSPEAERAGKSGKRSKTMDTTPKPVAKKSSTNTPKVNSLCPHGSFLLIS